MMNANIATNISEVKKSHVWEEQISSRKGDIGKLQENKIKYYNVKTTKHVLDLINIKMI